jgi:hypothetical protein
VCQMFPHSSLSVENIPLKTSNHAHEIFYGHVPPPILFLVIHIVFVLSMIVSEKLCTQVL